MHGRGGENWRRHMWPDHSSGPQAPPVVVRSSSSPFVSSDSVVRSSVDSFLKDGRKIQVGDCALFQAGNAPPFIGIIRWFTGKEDCLKLCVNWLYRPADVKLGKGILLDAAPNEVFYSFHKDVISAASLLHPCKVSFLRKGVELPSGISSFVCRRVYDIANKCLWWLTDQDYINERQEEVDQLLDKTRLEMHATVQSGGRSPKQLNGQSSAQQLKPGSDSIQYSGTSFPSQVKGKKRDRGGDQGTEPVKRERATRLEDGESVSSRLDNMTKVEIGKIAEKGALITIEVVEKLVHLIQLDRDERKIDLSGRILLANVIAATDRIECLSRFVQLRGVPVLDDWLQEAHKGKTGDGSSPKESDKGTEELLLALLRALDKLPVNLNALQTCNIGKSVNHLRGHKNLEIQKKARSLVDIWKKRVDAEMTKINDAKSSGTNQIVTWPGKAGFSEVSHPGSRRSAMTEAFSRTSITQTSTSKTLAGKPGHTDTVVKSTAVTPGSLKLISSLHASVSVGSKDSPGKGAGSSGVSDLPPLTVKEEKSSSSSQSQNNSQSCSSDQAKTVGSSLKEDAKTSTAGSVNGNKSSAGSARHRRSGNGSLTSIISGVQKEGNIRKTGSFNRNTPADKVSSPSGLCSERVVDMPGADHGNNPRLIVRLPNHGRSPARSASGGSADPSVPDAHVESWQSNDVKEGLVGSNEGDLSSIGVLDEEHRSADETERSQDVSRADCSASGNGKGVSIIEPKSRNLNALIESCAKYSESSVPLSAEDDIGINLLANVAAGEISKSELATPSASPGSSPKEEPCATNNEDKSRSSNEDGVVQSGGRSDEDANLRATEKLQETSMHVSGDCKIITPFRENQLTSEHYLKLPASNVNLYKVAERPVKHEVKSEDQSTDNCLPACIPKDVKERLKTDGADQLAIDDNMSADCSHEKLVESSSKAADLTGNSLDNGCDRDTTATDGIRDKLGAESSGVNLADRPQVLVAKNSLDAADRVNSDDSPSSATDNVSGSDTADVRKPKKSHELEDSKMEPNDSAREGQCGHASNSSELVLSAAVALATCNHDDDILKQTQENHRASSDRESPSTVPTQGFDNCAKPTPSKYPGPNLGKPEDVASSAEPSSVLVTSDPADTGAKLDFDLNEGFSEDDGNQREHLISAAPVCSPAIQLPGLSPFASGSASNGVPAPITVAAPAKGPFVPPENLLKSKGEHGWKGSAATSAFRPAEPRKVLEMQLNTSDAQSSETGARKQGGPLLIDLNVADDRILEDMASQSSPQTTGSESGVMSNRDATTQSAGGLDLDLNKADDSTDTGQFLTSTSRRLEVPLMSKPASGGFSNGEANMLRDFDLNSGPGLDDTGADVLPKNQNVNSNNMPFLPALSGLRMGNTEFANVSSWFPPGNSYPAVAIPSFLPDRGEHTYPIVGGPGTQRILGAVTGGGTFGSDLYRGPVLSSSPAMAFSPAAAFPYQASFPFGSSFPLTSTSFSGGSTTYVDSPSGPASGFPSIPSQLMGPAGAVSSSHYARPYMVSLPEGSTLIGSENSRKWGRQGLDLNAGPGSTADVDVKDERLPLASRQLPIGSSQAFVEEQARMFQLSGGSMKRKEREGGTWDERFYKQPSWQ